jgi:BirA family biotin operon repressor/biotin-[acetyl-CoA-carboxylase] ligase
MRRNWISPEGNVYAAWRLPVAGRQWGGVSSLLVGYALMTGLSAMGVELRLKWPNDLLLEGRKVGGILVEERDNTLMAGIGLNLGYCPGNEDLRRDTVIPAARLGPFFENVHIVPFWTELVSRARNCYEQQISQESTREFIHLLEPFLAFLHQEVTVSGTSRIHRARVLGLHHDGGLRLQHDQEELVLYSGSVQPEIPG